MGEPALESVDDQREIFVSHHHISYIWRTTEKFSILRRYIEGLMFSVMDFWKRPFPKSARL